MSHFNLWSFLIPFTMVISLGSSPAFSGSGDLDKSFGSKGKVTAPPSNGGAQDLAIQADGKIVAAGTSLVRYLPNGTLDAGFGTSGEVMTGIGLNGVVVQADGKIVVVATSSGTGSDFILQRYTSSGILDGGFGSGGQVTIDFGGSDYGEEVAIQGDGKIVVVGGHNGTDFAIARLNPDDGSLDADFGSQGKVLTAFAGGAGASAVLTQPGMILVAGTSGDGFALARYISDGIFAGELDSTFGVSGKVSGPAGVTADMAIQTDGKILLGGSDGGQGAVDFAMVRYHANGTLDTFFGVNGKVTTDFFGDNDWAYGIGVQADGKIVLGGTSYHLDYRGSWTNPIWEFALAQYNPDGSLDLGFGPSHTGKVTTNVVWFDYAYALALQPDGKIVMGGLTFGNRPGDIATYAIVRYLP